MWLGACLGFVFGGWLSGYGMACGFVRSFGYRSRMLFHWSFRLGLFVHLLRRFLVLGFH